MDICKSFDNTVYTLTENRLGFHNTLKDMQNACIINCFGNCHRLYPLVQLFRHLLVLRMVRLLTQCQLALGSIAGLDFLVSHLDSCSAELLFTMASVQRGLGVEAVRQGKLRGMSCVNELLVCGHCVQDCFLDIYLFMYYLSNG